jgi:hypothetical protein
MINRLFIIFFAALTTSTSWAYIPPYWMIMSRVAENHGKGMYVVDQDLIFPATEGEPLIVNEKWYVMSEGKFRVEVTGRRQLKDKINLIYVYDESRRHFIDEAGVRKSIRTPNDFFEPLFHFRFSKSIRPYLVAQKIAPAESLRSEPHKYSQKNPQPEPENFIRLGRIDGIVTYIVGLPTLPNSSNKSPGIWIDQDQFNIRQVRYPSQVQVTARRYNTYSQGFKFPRERDITFNNVTIRAVTNSVNSIAASGENKLRVEPQSLAKATDFKALLPDDPTIRNFYSSVR